MSCASRHRKNVLCFECYRARLDVTPTRRFANVTLFPNPGGRSLIPALRRPSTPIQLEHRRAMLAHMTASAASAGGAAASAPQ